jgi:Fe2+ transport system protein FeoA
MTEVALNTLLPGESGTVIRMDAANPKVRQRLLEMGLIRGTPIELVRFAPMGDPIEVRVKGYRLSLRREEASSVIVERVTR